MESHGRAARRVGAAALGLAGLALAGLDLRAQPRFSDTEMVWSWFGARLCAPLASEEFLARGFELLPLLAALALAASALAGWFAARGLGLRGTGSRIGCALACALSFNPWVALFVAGRQPFAAPRYLDAGDLFRALGLAAIALALLCVLPRRPRAEPLPAPSSRPGAALLLAMLAALALPSLVLPFASRGPQLTNDEQAYVFQAQLFARGELVDERGELADFFPAPQTQVDAGRIFSKYPPGHSALLVPGVLVGWPLLVPRLLAALSVLLVWSLARRFGLARPVLCAWIFALSPFFLSVESLALAHGTTLPLTLLFTWCALKALDERALGWAALGGLSISLAFSARPVTALAIALPVCVLLVRERPRGVLALVGCALAAALPAAAFFLWNNQVLTGDPLETAYGRFNDARNSLFGAVAPAQAFSIALFNLGRLSLWVHGLAPGLLLTLIGLSCRPWPRRGWLLPAIPASLFLAYALHPFQGVPWCGPVYLVEALPALVLLSARGLEALEAVHGKAVLHVTGTASLFGSAWLLQQHFTAAREELELREAPRRAAAAAGIERGIVFLDLENMYARSLFPLAPFDERQELVFARDLGPRDEELVRVLGGPPSWIYDPVAKTLRRR